MLFVQLISNSGVPATYKYFLRGSLHVSSAPVTTHVRTMSTNQGNTAEILANVFSEDSRKRCLDFLTNKRTGFKFQNISFAKRAAVLIPLCYNVKGEPAILYTLRSLKLNSHRGEISFPGGAADPEDGGDPVATALRETEEELGLTKDQIEIWGQMSPMPTASTLMGVTPVLGFIKLNPVDPSKLKINPDEVHIAFTISLQHFCDPANWGHTQYRRGLGMPVYKNMNVFHSTKDPNHDLMVQISDNSSSSDDDGKGKLCSKNDPNSSSPNVKKTTVPAEGQREIKLWGLTAILTHLTLEALLPTLYKKHVSILKSCPSSSPDSKCTPGVNPGPSGGKL